MPPRSGKLALAPGLFALTVLVLIVVGAFIANSTVVAGGGDNLVTRCERLSGVVGNKLAAHGVAVGSADWRRQKQLAFRACIDDIAAFERLISAQ